MANEFGIDIGNVLSRVEAIKEARTRNQYLPQQMAADLEGSQTNNAMAKLKLGALPGELAGEAQGRSLTNRGAALRLTQLQQDYNDETHARKLRAAAMGGDASAMGELATMSPASAKQFHDFLDGLDEDKKKELSDNIDKVGKMVAYVKNADDPAAAYTKARSLLTPEAQKQTPATWDPDWGDATLAQAMDLKDIIKQNAGGDENAPSGYRFMPNGNLQVIPGGPADKKGKSGDTLDTTAANGIKSTVAMQFGGEWDPQTGEFSLLDKTQANRMLEVMAAAQDIVRDDPTITPARAVQQAMSKGGNAMANGDVPTPQSQADYDALASGAEYIDPDDGQRHRKP